MYKKGILIIFSVILFLGAYAQNQKELDEVKSYFQSKEFRIEKIDGIGFEKGVTRRDINLI